jgi:aspartate 1-decarboxylase
MMLRPFLRCKIHHATVTDASLDYVGSMTIPQDLMKKLDIEEGEQVEVANLNNGERWTTYALPGKKNGVFTLNGAAARMGAVGDKLIIMVYCLLNEQEVKDHRLKVAFLGEGNKLLRLKI